MRPRSLLPLLPVLLLGVLPCGCASLDEARPPHWRVPGPALTAPPPREKVPDDGYRASLAWRRVAQPAPG